ncbi:ribonuclease H-like domain-containing protein [Leifsonia sp. NPDC056665]|uniref:ribonuclease H-like domain-containing protein n=1 Tax=Leifsonia sp. NPDC056665 TaxID=3345901 RepID=UPI0036C67206
MRRVFTRIPPIHRPATLAAIDQAYFELQARNVEYFATRLPRREYWRLATAFPERVLFLDIETTGLSRIYHQLTLIGWAREDAYGIMTTNVGLPGMSELVKELETDPILVTYNGSHFDVPFLKNALPDLRLPSVHVDLRHLGQRVGLVGGQKKIEQQLGLARSRKVRGIAGELAPALWFRYQRGDAAALLELIEYNHADVEGLKILLRHMVERLDPALSASWHAVPFDRWMTERPDHDVLLPFAGDFRPRLQLGSLQIDPNLRVVGIDLSGGPARHTGWALLAGAEVETSALSTDEEILDKTIAAKPTLVSIDAPLSLPTGRLRVDDDDPTREEYGITRHAERELRGRGVNTYPALIRSMQGLTARGIRLAGELRARGIPVIESFPGAMQDILGMPRKGMSLPALKLSLLDYGLAPSFLDRPVIHDEIDAVSSAIVGQAFWADHYEPLGNDAEGFLIVPATTRWPTPHIITLSGPVAAGKSTLAYLLEECGLARIRYSEVLAEDMRSSARATLASAGAALHRSGGQRSLNERVYARIANADRAVVDGVRYPEDLAFAIERSGSHLTSVFVDAPRTLRAKRWGTREGSSAEFEKAEIDTSEAHLGFLRERATLVFDNSGSLYDLKMFASRLSKRSAA